MKNTSNPWGFHKTPWPGRSGVAPRAINEIVHGKRSITPQMSIRFGAFFNQSVDFWHGIQVECDFRALRKEAKQLAKYIQPAESLMVCED